MNLRTRLPHVLLASLGLVFSTAGAQAATYYVATTGNDANAGTQAAPFRTIAKGLATAAASGDTVFLANGTYNERGLDFGSKNLVLRSSSDAPGSCIVDCQGLGNGFYLRGGQTSATLLRGITVQNAVPVGTPFTGSFGSSAIYVSNSDPTIANCILRNNNSVASVGLLVAAGSHPTITGCTFTTTVTQAATGSIVAVRGDGATISGCTFSNNANVALELSSGTTTVTSCNFTSNNVTSQQLNGSSQMLAGTATLTLCRFTSNSAAYGGALAQSGGTLVLDRCQFLGNAAVAGGGAIYGTAGDLTARNCLFANNTGANTFSTYGTTLQFDGATNPGPLLSPKFVNCTLTGTWGPSYLAAKVVVYVATLTVTNSIFYGGTFQGDFFTASGGQVVANHCNLEGSSSPGTFPVETNCISANPLFVNAGAGNYRLQAASTSINAGTAAAATLTPLDLDGGPRVFGSAPDLGAYEFWNSATGSWFVDRAVGNDTTGNGSPATPYATVTKAVTSASAGHRIYTKAGNYGTDRPRITKVLKLYNWLGPGRASIGQP